MRSGYGSIGSRDEEDVMPEENELVGGTWVLKPIRLVPVEVFGADDGYGLADAVQAWSDCNRARGRIYRVDDVSDRNRVPRETVTVYVREEDVEWFDKKWGDDADS